MKKSIHVLSHVGIGKVKKGNRLVIPVRRIQLERYVIESFKRFRLPIYVYFSGANSGVDGVTYLPKPPSFNDNYNTAFAHMEQLGDDYGLFADSDTMFNEAFPAEPFKIYEKVIAAADMLLPMPSNHAPYRKLYEQHRGKIVCLPTGSFITRLFFLKNRGVRFPPSNLKGKPDTEIGINLLRQGIKIYCTPNFVEKTDHGSTTVATDRSSRGEVNARDKEFLSKRYGIPLVKTKVGLTLRTGQLITYKKLVA